MNATELLTTRAELLLGEVRQQGKAATLFHLDGVAGTMLPDLQPEDRRSAVNEALRLANRAEGVAPPPGYVPPSERKTERPRRSPPPARRKPAPAARNGGSPSAHPQAPNKVAERSIAPAVAWTPSSVRAFARDFLTNVPDASNAEIWQAVVTRGDPGFKLATFTTYHMPMVRKALNGGAPPPEDAAPDAPDATPDATDATPPAPEASASPEITADPPESDPPQPAAVGAAVDLVLPSSEPKATRGLVEISSGWATFTARRREDGEWDIELRGIMDDADVDQLAAIMWEKVVGTVEKRGGG